MTLKHPSCILVDLDGTLANNIPTLYAAYKHFLGHFQIAGTEQEFIDLIGPPLSKAVEILKDRHKIDRPLDELIKLYMESIQEGYRCSYELHTDADTFLEWAKRNQIPLVLATAAPKRLAMDFIRRYDLIRFFDRIITADDTHLTKVDPNYFLQIADNPADTLMIDDSPTVIAAAQKAGLRTHHFQNDWKYLLEQFSIKFTEVKLQPYFEVEVISGEHKTPYDESTRRRIDAIWESECAKNPDTLFNGQILNYIESTTNRLVGEFVQYKDYIAQNIYPDLKQTLKIHPVGITVFVTDGSKVLIGERSTHVATHHHLFELVPSGAVDAAFFHNGKIDLEKLVLHELKEEAGITKKNVETLRATHIVHDPATDFYEICCILTVHEAGPLTISREHSELLWVPFEKAKEFIKDNPFVPLSEYILQRIL